MVNKCVYDHLLYDILSGNSLRSFRFRLLLLTETDWLASWLVGWMVSVRPSWHRTYPHFSRVAVTPRDVVDLPLRPFSVTVFQKSWEIRTRNSCQRFWNVTVRLSHSVIKADLSTLVLKALPVASFNTVQRKLKLTQIGYRLYTKELRRRRLRMVWAQCNHQIVSDGVHLVWAGNWSLL